MGKSCYDDPDRQPAMAMTTRFHHSRNDGTFIYVRAATAPSAHIGYALGHELTNPPHAH